LVVRLLLGGFSLLIGVIPQLKYFSARNAKSLGYYWRTWNLPVHNWMKRHIYMPLINRGYNKWTASLAAFFVSAVFHEVCS